MLKSHICLCQRDAVISAVNNSKTKSSNLLAGLSLTSLNNNN